MTLIVYLKEFFEKVDFEKSADKKVGKISQGAELMHRTRPAHGNGTGFFGINSLPSHLVYLEELFWSEPSLLLYSMCKSGEVTDEDWKMLILLPVAYT